MWADIPAGYIPGLSREVPYLRLAHLYKGTFSEPGLPMCKRGWNRYEGTAYSIWRGIYGTKGVCGVCLRRARNGMDGVEAEPEKLTHLNESNCDDRSGIQNLKET